MVLWACDWSVWPLYPWALAVVDFGEFGRAPSDGLLSRGFSPCFNNGLNNQHRIFINWKESLGQEKGHLKENTIGLACRETSSNLKIPMLEESRLPRTLSSCEGKSFCGKSTYSLLRPACFDLHTFGLRTFLTLPNDCNILII